MERRPESDAATGEAAGWIEHDGKGCPVAGNVEVIVKYRDGEIDLEPAEACSWGNGDVSSNWSHEFTTGHDIVAYRVVTR